MSIRVLIAIIGTIISFTFTVAVAYSSINQNTIKIEEMKPKVEKISVLETRLDGLVKGQDEIKNLINETLWQQHQQ